MHKAVQDNFRKFNEPFEGVVSFMYVDIKGLVTVGVGNLIDPVGLALDLPFEFRDKPGIATPGKAASKAEIRAEWSKIKADQSLAQRGHRAAGKVATLELDDDGVAALIAQRLQANETTLKRTAAFKDFDAWPADAQLGVLSMAWAMGPGFGARFPKFSAACKRQDFAAAAQNCRIAEAGNPGVVPRNVADRQLFVNAGVVVADGSDRSVLRFPKKLKPGG